MDRIAKHLGPLAAAHVLSWGEGAGVELLERWAIMVEDGHVPERTAWTQAYLRECLRRGTTGRLQSDLFGAVG